MRQALLVAGAAAAALLAPAATVAQSGADAANGAFRLTLPTGDAAPREPLADRLQRLGQAPDPEAEIWVDPCGGPIVLEPATTS